MPAFLVQITDPHVVAGPEGDAAAAALTQVVAEIAALPLPPTAVLLSGDLTHDGAPASYARVKELLAPLSSPVHVIAGNHDSAAIWDAFPREDAVDVGDLRLVLLDTSQPGTDAGRLILPDGLEARPTVIAMHHPPLRTGVKAIDDLGLSDDDRAALIALLERSPQVLRVVCGHVHRTTFETLGGVGVFTCPATFEQAEPANSGHPPGLAFVERGRAFALHTWINGAFVTQIQPV